MWPMPLCGPFGCLSVRHICVDCRARLDFCGNIKTVTYDIVHTVNVVTHNLTQVQLERCRTALYVTVQLLSCSILVYCVCL